VITKENGETNKMKWMKECVNENGKEMERQRRWNG